MTANKMKISGLKKKGGSSGNGPLPVFEFYTHFSFMMSRKYTDVETRKKATVALYYGVVIEAVDFNKQVPPVNDVDFDVAKGKSMALQAEDESVICYLVRGTKDDRLQHNRMSGVFKEATESLEMIITPKMLEALISIELTVKDWVDLVKDDPARLGANLIKLNKDDSIRNGNWGAHFHAGLPFVANYCKHIKDRVEARAKFPPDEIFLVASHKMDMGNKKYSEDGGSTLSSLIQTVQWDPSYMDSLIGKIEWIKWPNSSAAGMAMAAAKGIREKMLAQEKNVGVNHKKPSGDGSY